MSAERQEANLPARLRNFVGVATNIMPTETPKGAYRLVERNNRVQGRSAAGKQSIAQGRNETGLLGNAYRSGVNNEHQTRR
jgi:hypothetical protein